MTRAPPDQLREIVGQAIYETHLKPTSELLADRSAPQWEDVSKAVRKWVLDQADAAILSFAKAGYMIEPGLNDEMPEL